MSPRSILTVLAAASLLAVLVGPASAARLEHAPHGGAPVATELSSDQEVPAVASPGTGDFEATINPGQGEICYVLSWRDLTAPAIAAHIHSAPAGQNGPVVVPLETTDTTTGSVAACTSVDRELAKAIIKDPEAYYVNVHTSMFPPGEIRGQLSR